METKNRRQKKVKKRKTIEGVGEYRSEKEVEEAQSGDNRENRMWRLGQR